MENTRSNHKCTANSLAEQVKTILQKRGYSAVFNMEDFEFFRHRVRKSYGVAYEIAARFIEEAQPEQNDFNEYIF